MMSSCVEGLDCLVEGYVQRCVRKEGNELYDTVHVILDSNINETACGKQLNEMWFITSSDNMNEDSVSCKKCRRKIKVK